jgi:sterol desaturase/sphingolipid hydroxylase (fatty acid hydroxylase superfamily)
MAEVGLRSRAVGAMVGWASWTLAEYALHRWAMHGPVRRQPVAQEHLRHHREPMATDPVLRSLTYLPAAIGGAALGAALRRVTDSAAGQGAAAGFLAGYAAYEQLHWRSHHRPPAVAYERWLRQRHATHHARARRNYGVTTSVWDRAFGTAAR